MINEIEKMMSEAGASLNYRIINLGGQSIYIEGIKSVVCLEECEMSFQLKNKLLKVLGEYLKVKYLDKSTCVIVGEIKVVTVQ